MAVGYLYNPIEADDDDWLLTESGASLVAETIIGITGECSAGWQNALLSTEDDDWLTTEAGDGLTTEQTIGPVGIAQGVATFRLVGSVAVVGTVGTAAGTGTVGESEEIPDWLWGMHFAAAHKQNLKLRPLVGKVQAHGVAGTAQGTASFRTSADLLNDLLAKPMHDVQFEADIRALGAAVGIALPETLAQADLEPVWLLLMNELADGG